MRAFAAKGPEELAAWHAPLGSLVSAFGRGRFGCRRRSFLGSLSKILLAKYCSILLRHRQRRRTILALVVAALVVTGCGGDKDNDGSDPVPLKAGDRLGWAQSADSIQSLRAHTYRLYIDGDRANLADVRCSETRTSAGYECSGLFPGMTAGRHSLELTSVLDGVESPRSAPFMVSVSTAATAPGGSSTISTTANMEARAACAAVSSDGECFDVRVLATGLNSPSALSPTSDGRLFFIERASRVRVIANGALLNEPALELTNPETRIVGLAPDANFEQTHSFFVAWTELTWDRRVVVNITRYREVNGILGEGAQILTGLPTRADSVVPLGVDGDGYVYAALPAAETDPGRQPTAVQGVVLRVDRNGAAPETNPRASPIITFGFERPTSLAIDDSLRRLWLGGASVEMRPLRSMPIPRSKAEWPQGAVAVDPSALLDARAQVESLALKPASRDGIPLSTMLVAKGSLFLATRTAEGRMYAVRNVALEGGTALAVASATQDSWYVAIRSEGGPGLVVLMVDSKR